MPGLQQLGQPSSHQLQEHHGYAPPQQQRISVLSSRITATRPHKSYVVAQYVDDMVLTCARPSKEASSQQLLEQHGYMLPQQQRKPVLSNTFTATRHRGRTLNGGCDTCCFGKILVRSYGTCSTQPHHRGHTWSFGSGYYVEGCANTMAWLAL